MRYIEAKTILSKLRQNDNWFGITYNMNLYRGCQHGCIYCDTRSECYGIGDISELSVKRNALELLRRELNARRANKGTIGTGSMNDPYMPVDKELQLTRKALQIIADRNFPVHVITKSGLVQRDQDVLQQISATYSAVSFSITTADDRLAEKIEPHASAASRRFETMKKMAEAGIYTGVVLMPVLPFINDNAANIKELLQRASDCGASYVLPMFGVTLRKGSRDYFYRELEREFPGIKEKYETTYRDSYECFSPAYNVLNETFRQETARLGLACRMNFYQPPVETQLSLF